MATILLDRWDSEQVSRAADAAGYLVVKHNVHPRNRRVVLFVHGLKGHILNTWGRFPELVFNSALTAEYDVALYGYETGILSNFIPWKTKVDLRDRSRELAGIIRDAILSQELYERVTVVCHSLGGILVKMSIKSLIELDLDTAKKVHALFLYGTPQYGSQRAVFPATLFSPEIRVLRTFGPEVRDLQLFWNTRIAHQPVPADDPRFFLEERAVISNADRWVNQGSGVGNLPDGAIRVLSVSHTKLSKPESESDDSFAYFVGELHTIERQRRALIIAIEGADMAALEVLSGEEDRRNGAGGGDGVDDTDEHVAEQAVLRLFNSFFHARYVLDTGRSSGVQNGDVFLIIYDRRVVTQDDGRPLDVINRSKGMLVVSEVRERTSSCTLQDFAYKVDPNPLKALPRPGDEVERVSGETWVRVRAMEDFYGESINSLNSDEARHKALVQLLIASQEFLESNSTSYFRETALWHKAWSQLKLGRYEESVHSFESFLQRHPFSTSVDGAHEWIKEARLRQRVEQTGGDARWLSQLGNHLVQSERDAEEGLDVLRRALATNPKVFFAEATPEAQRRLGLMLLKTELSVPGAQLESLVSKVATDPQARAQLTALIDGAPGLTPDERQIVKVPLAALIETAET